MINNRSGWLAILLAAVGLNFAIANDEGGPTLDEPTHSNSDYEFDPPPRPKP